MFFKGKTDGFYIDIGANDGISGSTTYWAEQIGWKGICVEPQKSTFERMKKVRNCTLYNCAVSNKSQENVRFISFPDKDTRSGLADSMSQSHIETAKQFSDMEKNFVSTKTFGDIMADFENVKFIDFLSIDTEGHEMQVLESIDFTKFKFGLITIETEDGSDVAAFIEKNDYKKFMIAGSDCLFVPENYNIPVSCAVYPFENGTNKYTELMKNILRMINVKPTNNFTASDFIWLHWFENITSTEDFRQKTDFLKICEKNGRKIIWNVHNKQPHETTNAEQIKSLMISLAQSAHKIIIHSKITTQVIKELCENDEKILRKIIYVHHPHYAGTYGTLSSQNSISNDKLKFLFFGQIRPYKNIELLINVFNDLNFDDVELNICGSCTNENYKRNLQDLIKTNKIKTDFRFIPDSEIPELFAQNHMLLLPYSLESSLNSGATLLAFSYSKSVISSLTGTLDDIEDKSLFFYYDYKTPEEHEQKLKEILTQIHELYHKKYDVLLTLGKKCRKTVLENNSYLKIAQELAKVFDIKLSEQNRLDKEAT
ncbi:MAG: FkbM family methyltransferase [Chitinispirillales bacterium]|nr:FkbM family methyltransferase [Chitinispirillales bacterium]